MTLDQLDSAAWMGIGFFLGYASRWAMDTLSDIRNRLDEKEVHDEDA